jgi:hypothetical protein
VSASRAGSRRAAPGWCGCVRWRAWLPPSPEGLDDDHAAAAAGTGWEPIEWLWHFDRLRRRCHRKRFAGSRYMCLAGGTGEQAVMANAVEAMWQDMEQEAADELVRRERRDTLSLRTIAAVVFVAEGDARRTQSDAGLRWQPGGCSARDRRARPPGRRTADWHTPRTASS